MDFRAAARKSAASSLTDSNLSSDLSMDPTMQDTHDPRSTIPHGQGPVHTDGQDPASSGGSAPYNGVEPFGEPAVDDPLWRDPSEDDPGRGGPMPHVDGPDEDKTTLHNARLASYAAKADRYGR
jgi:hypothetical protein